MKLKKIFQIAEKSGFAIGHFNISNIETFEAAVIASKETKRPIVIATSEGAIKHGGIDIFVGAKEYYEKKYKIDIFLHLDHGKDLRIINEAIEKGYDGVMVDGSGYSFNKNVSLTKRVVKKAHRYGVAVEAEIGTIGGAEENVRSRSIKYTDPVMAKEFVEKTNCDLLAIAIGTSHGVNKFAKKSKLEFDLLKKIDAMVDVPLVLHGASEIRSDVVKKLTKYGVKFEKAVGVSEKDIKKAIKNGIRKINTDTDLQLIMMLELRKELKTHPKDIKLYHILDDVKIAMKEEVKRKIKLFNK